MKKTFIGAALLSLSLFSVTTKSQEYPEETYNLTGDYDQDGFDDIAIWAPQAQYGGHWMYLASSENYQVIRGFIWGIETDIPVVGDFDHDGFSDVTVYRESTNTYYVLKSSCNWTCYRAITGIYIYR